jgi:hypothetical protein
MDISNVKLPLEYLGGVVEIGRFQEFSILFWRDIFLVTARVVDGQFRGTMGLPLASAGQQRASNTLTEHCQVHFASLCMINIFPNVHFVLGLDRDFFLFLFLFFSFLFFSFFCDASI